MKSRGRITASSSVRPGGTPLKTIGTRGHAMSLPEAVKSGNKAESEAQLREEIALLRKENRRLRLREHASIDYVRSKVDQLLGVLGTLPLKPEELDDDTLLSLDPIGIVSDSFVQILENLKTTNDSLAVARDELDVIFQLAGAGIMVLDPEGRIVSYNRQLVEQFPVKTENLCGHLCAEAFCHGGGRSGDCVFELVMDSGTTQVRKNWLSNNRHFDVVGTPVKNARGEIVQVILVYNDITERLRHEQTLVEANLRLDTMFDSVMAGILLIDRESHRIVDANRYAAQMVGVSRQELVGSGCCRFFCSTTSDECPVTVHGLQVENAEKQAFHSDGHVIPVQKTVVPIVLDNRHYLLESFVDITERKKAEASVRAALAEAEDARGKMDGILQSVADALVVTDADHQIVLMNRAAEKHFGICLFESLGLPLQEVIGKQGGLEAWQKFLDQKGGAGAIDLEFTDPGGARPRIFQARTSEISGSGGRTSGYITILQNVTIEREIDRMKSEFVSTAAHELQTPLASIIGFSELLLLQKDELPADVQQESLSYIFEKAESLSKIVDDLLDISRIESGRPIELFAEPCDLKDLVTSTVRPYQAHQQNHQVEVYLCSEPAEVTADRRKLEQVLDNILSNAFKYSPGGGVVRLRVCREGAHYRVSVEDCGIGMTAEQQERVFEKFYRANASDSSIGGTGLGMSVARFFVEAHGGRIWVESEPAKGTRVSFSLPLTFVSQQGRSLFGKYAVSGV